MLHTASQAHKQVQEELGSFRCNVCCDSCSSCAWKNGPIKLGNLNNYLPEKTRRDPGTCPKTRGFPSTAYAQTQTLVPYAYRERKENLTSPRLSSIPSWAWRISGITECMQRCLTGALHQDAAPTAPRPAGTSTRLERLRSIFS